MGSTPATPPGQANAGPIVTYLVTVGALGTASWLWTIWAVKRQKSWALTTATIIFVLASGDALVNLLAREYGNTILPTPLGILVVLPCLAGLVAVILLWRA